MPNKTGYLTTKTVKTNYGLKAGMLGLGLGLGLDS